MGLAVALSLAAAPVVAAESEGGQRLPRFVSLRSDQVNLRVGPGENYPIEWVLTRKEMPVEITGQLDDVRPRFDRVIALSRPAHDVTDEAMALVFGAELDAWEGKHDEAALRYEHGIVAVPHLGFMRDGIAGVPQFVFRPCNPLTQADFAVV